jgi:hypothetical protein
MKQIDKAYQYKVTREYNKSEFDSHIGSKLLTWLANKDYDFEFEITYPRGQHLDANYYFKDSKQAFHFELTV